MLLNAKSVVSISCCRDRRDRRLPLVAICRPPRGRSPVSSCALISGGVGLEFVFKRRWAGGRGWAMGDPRHLVQVGTGDVCLSTTVSGV
jgi:hypothetical protein